MADIQRRLAFEDLSITLSRLVDQGHGTAPDDVKSKLAELLSSYEKHRKKAEDRLSDAKDQAIKQANSTGNKQLLKRQLQSLKSSLLNLGQKESFADAILLFSEQHDYRAEAGRSAAALEASSEDLKDLKKENQQDEEHLQESLHVIDTLQEQHRQVAARLAMKLDMTARDLASAEASKVPPASPLPAAMQEEDLENLIAQQSALANTLETSLAKSEAQCKDLEGDLQAALSDICHVEGEIARLKALKEDEARVADDRHRAALAWCDVLMDILAQATGVSLVSIGEDEVSLRLQHDAPAGTGAAAASGAAASEHVLTARLQPGTSLLASAALNPPASSIDVAALVEFARETGGGLPLLLNMVREMLYERADTSQGPA